MLSTFSKITRNICYLQMLSTRTSLECFHLHPSSDDNQRLGQNLPFPKEALVFMCLQFKFFENTLEKEKLLLTNNFSFSHSVFYPFGEVSIIFVEFEIVICKLFQLKRV